MNEPPSLPPRDPAGFDGYDNDANQPREGDSGYATFADKVGMVPNVRKKDNKWQAIATGVGCLIGAIVGFAFWRTLPGALIGLLGGMILGAFLSGLVLMVVGLTRSGKS